ncbi:hypothetical protein ACLVWQ_37560 (plasmid) [Streptomyces sp. CWNU-52B]
MRFATNEAAKGWGELGAEAPGTTRRCFEALRGDPVSRADPDRQHRLRGRLAAGNLGGREYPQWKFEVTAGGRATQPAAEPSGPASQCRGPSRHRGMNTKIRYANLGFLGVTAVYTGVWAYFAPEQWHASFPGFGMRWLPQLGPYNEHLAKDAGAMFLALAALTVIALCSVRNNRLVQTVGAAWLVFNVLHLVYHMQHLGMYGTRDQVLNVVVLSLLVLSSASLLVPARIPRGDTG